MPRDTSATCLYTTLSVSLGAASTPSSHSSHRLLDFAVALIGKWNRRATVQLPHRAVRVASLFIGRYEAPSHRPSARSPVCCTEAPDVDFKRNLSTVARAQLPRKSGRCRPGHAVSSSIASSSVVVSLPSSLL
ncbi:hypothetical protein BJ912DRAFT_1059406 [Pholiota molesta]|nr:hypothetical protein BJ912DRAFT_1059406 [Pholiota molesta]